MKLKKSNTQSVPSYPLFGVARTLLVGTSITATLVLTGCHKKETSESAGDSKEAEVKPHQETLKGKIPQMGIPNDTDNDGINDSSDKCPNIKGIPANSGCPPTKTPKIQMLGELKAVQPPQAMIQGAHTKIKDTDGDGVPDAKDRCPNKKGPKHRAGCPQPRTRGRIARPKNMFNPDLPKPHEKGIEDLL